MKNWFTTQGKALWAKHAPRVGLMLAGFISGLIGAAIVNYGVGTPAFWDVAAQPMATLSTGLLAIGAATIAFIGVRNAQTIAIDAQKQQAEQHQDQIRLQNDAQMNQARQHFAQLESLAELERSKHRRQVTFDSLVAANNSLVELNEAFILIDGAVISDLEAPDSGHSAEDAARAQCEIRLTACTSAASLLLLLGLEDSHRAIMTASAVVREQLVFRPNKQLSFVTMEKFGLAFRAAVDSLVGKYDADVGAST